ncbi:hypothetical protein BDV38DRAFT_259978 [Aspergillus pseudotamarii]|uniref:Uncharacterized protein n=1 Tax=Aspergillus pseudotamarii TaxID=132259 RepID=A0A5N6SGT0_ASPPS|nr:uncharacterized protein BDV38DRAFT_259978 [Aspergillus pseudotamarii]KAE8132940.1 hypothetical protein BDV38DRAFT_259978 [Aspergillus pseudotamarii]
MVSKFHIHEWILIYGTLLVICMIGIQKTKKEHHKVGLRTYSHEEGNCMAFCFGGVKMQRNFFNGWASARSASVRSYQATPQKPIFHVVQKPTLEDNLFFSV